MTNNGNNLTLCRLTPDGQADSAWGNNGTAYADFWGKDDVFWDLAVLPDGKILACGSSVNPNGTGYGYPAVARFKVVPRTAPSSVLIPVQHPTGQLQLYPNPTNSAVNLKGAFAGDKVQVWNEMGQAVLETTLVSPKVDISALPVGLYQVQLLRTGHVVGTARLVKE